jgi:hypothetical protein
MNLAINYKGSEINKKLLLASFPNYIDYLKDLKGKEINLIVEAIKDYTILRMKLKANEELTVSDFFDNREKVFEVVSFFVGYHLDNPFMETKYYNVSKDKFAQNLFSGFAFIKGSFLIQEQENIFNVLRERELL